MQLSIGATDGIIETGEVLWGGRSLTSTNFEYAATKLGYAYSVDGQFYSGYHTEWFGTAEEARTMRTRGKAARCECAITHESPTFRCGVNKNRSRNRIRYRCYLFEQNILYPEPENSKTGRGVKHGHLCRYLPPGLQPNGTNALLVSRRTRLGLAPSRAFYLFLFAMALRLKCPQVVNEVPCVISA